MRDVFISYARDDRDHAAAVANALESRGVSVWWDRQIPPGRTFDEVIEEALTAARCVLVLWSNHAVESRWVRAEASAAAERGILIPILVEPVEPPLEFRNIHAADLTAWEGAVDHPEFQSLVASVSAMVQKIAGKTVPSTRSVVRSIPFTSRPAAIALFGLVAGASLAYVLLRPGSDAGRAREETSTALPSPIGGARTEQHGSAGPTDPAPGRSAIPVAGRVDLLAASNGGHLVRAPHEDWMQPIDGSEDWSYITGDEAVYAFRDNKPGTFDTFRMLITETRNWNIKTFELLAASDVPTGPFQSLGTFETQNVRLFPSAWQEFMFSPVRARYLKVRVLGLHRPTGSTQVEQWQLLGTF